MDQLQRTREEFKRQAAPFSQSLATTDAADVARLVDAIGSAARGRILDVACGPGIVTSALAAVAREVVALLTKPERRRVDLPIKYVGFEIANRFAIGYGLDHAQRYRNLRYVAALQQ